MTRFRTALPLLLALVVTLGASGLSTQPTSTSPDLATADVKWAQGDFAGALQDYIALLKGPQADAVFETIALQTGELFATEEITPDGRAPKLSLDGRYAAYETDTPAGPVTRIVRTEAGLPVVTEIAATGLSFAPDGARVAFLRPGTSDEIAKAQAALAAAAPGLERTLLQRQIAWLQSRSATLVARDLTTGRDTEYPLSGYFTSVVLHGPGQRLYFLGAREADLSRCDVYRVDVPGAEPVVVTPAAGYKTSPVFDTGFRTLLYTESTANPFARPEPGAAPAGGRGRGGGGGAAAGRFGLVNLGNGTTTGFEGMQPSLSADGSAVTYLTRAGAETTLVVRPVGGEANAAKKTTLRMAAPALSADGRRVAFQLMVRDDWEIVVADADGKNEMRVTREIQHDLQPVFLGPDRLLAVMGESRHRRSYLYDLSSLKQTRVFHNNTVRTIAPEYAWVPSPDGRLLLISAERDGDTVSPERGIYLVRLDTRISKADLIARLESNLAAERTLRQSAATMFKPIADQVTRATGAVSVDRIYGYEKDLYAFDSKHITQPGNRKAGEYLFNLYRSFGYDPAYQWFEPRGALGGNTANVLATLRGTTSPDVIYVISSHYDSNSVSPGADDNTSGTAVLVEAARVLSGSPLPATVIFASFTGEESGLLGSREFVRQAVTAKWRLVGALNNDMIGWANDQRLDNTIRYSNACIRDVQHAGAILFSKLITYDALYYKSTDAAAFYEAYGDIVGGFGSYPVLGSPHYHQPSDILDHVNHQLIAETTKATVASIMLLASSPSRVTDLRAVPGPGGTVEVTWAASPEKDVVRYVVTYGPRDAPSRSRLEVTTPRATLKTAGPGTVVEVKAVNARGLEGWDWARTTVTR